MCWNLYITRVDSDVEEFFDAIFYLMHSISLVGTKFSLVDWIEDKLVEKM